ncbi:MAG: hypothetical protein IPF99_43630 [Deltaproteobacteria bacterium]|nr:hypothetical protein [Deltaproteobacteria bacterium]
MRRPHVERPLPGGGHRWRHAGPCPAAPPAPTTPPTPPASPTDVPAWLARCAVAGRNGLNPQIEVPTDLTTAGRATLLDAVAHAPRDRRRCAAWALGRHAPVRALQRFWRAQLASSRDAQVHTEAFIALSELADPGRPRPRAAAVRAPPAPAPYARRSATGVA